MYLFYNIALYFMYLPNLWTSKLKFCQNYEKAVITIG